MYFLIEKHIAIIRIHTYAIRMHTHMLKHVAALLKHKITNTLNTELQIKKCALTL